MRLSKPSQQQIANEVARDVTHVRTYVLVECPFLDDVAHANVLDGKNFCAACGQTNHKVIKD